jgi:hypothetical protein
MKNYLPKHATALEACEWLATETGEPWPLLRLLESGLTPSIWLEYSPEAPKELFGDRYEGIFAPLLFANDLGRMTHTRTGLMTMTRLPNGLHARISPGIPFDLSELRFRREDITMLADNHSAPHHTPAAPATSPSDDDWKAQARVIADECFDRDTANGCRDSLDNYSNRVMEAMQERGIKGPRGIIDNKNTVKRDALQGKQWWANKPK